MNIDAKKLFECINVLKQSGKYFNIERNYLYSFGDQYIYSKAKSDIIKFVFDDGSTICSNTNFTILDKFPKAVYRIEQTVNESHQFETSEKPINFTFGSFPKVLQNELENIVYSIDDTNYLFKIDVSITEKSKIEMINTGNNVKIFHDSEIVNTIQSAKYENNEIRTNSWSSAIDILIKVTKKIDDKNYNKNRGVRKEIFDTCEDLGDTILHNFEKLDKELLHKKLDSLIKDIQSGKLNSSEFTLTSDTREIIF